MEKLTITVLVLLGGASLAFGSVESKDANRKAHEVIKNKCTGCHSEERITAAFSSGRDMKAIELEMEKKGAKLSNKEKSTLDFYWKQQPVLKK